MGSAKSSRTCGEIIFSQVSSVGQMAVFVGSLGTSSAATTGANTAKNVGKIATLKQKL